MISANSEIVKIKHHFYNQVILKDFIEHLTNALKSSSEPDHFHRQRLINPDLISFQSLKKDDRQAFL